MKHTITLLAILLFILRVEGQSLSPHVISSMGGSSSGSGISLSWTVGETLTATHSAEGLYLTQGFQQPNFMIVSAEQISSPDFEIRVFPNPATDFISIEWSQEIGGDIHVELYDMAGRRLNHQKSGNNVNHIRIDINSLQRSAYLLKVYSDKGEFSKTYRIIKY